MRCSVPGCKHDSQHISKSKGITYHMFPKKPSLRAAWIRRVRNDSWKPKKSSSVCSEHFLCDDLYETKSGLRRVRPGAMPINVKDSKKCKGDEMAYEKVCRICLATDCKLFSIRKYNLEQAYEDLTGYPMDVEDKLPQNLCPECAQRLYNYANFRTKSVRAASVMMDLVRKQETLTIKKVKSLRRPNSQFQSNLSSKHLGSDNYDCLLEEENLKDKEILSLRSEEFLKRIDAMLDSDDVNYTTDDSLPLVVTKGKKVIKQDMEKDENQSPNCTQENEFSDSDSKEEEMSDSNLDLMTEIKKDYKFKVENITEDESVTSDKDYTMEDRDYTTDASVEKVKPVKKTTKRKRPTPKSSEPKRRKKITYLSDDILYSAFTVTPVSHEDQARDIEKRKETSNFKQSRYKCMICFKGYNDTKAYESHMLKHTEASGEYCCSVCKIHYKRLGLFRKHMYTFHNYRYSCKECPYSTAARHLALKHEKWHKGTKYTCPHCPCEFLKPTTYMNHIRIKHPSTFVCQLCGYSFVGERGLMLHKLKKHHGDDTDLSETSPRCESCDTRFRDKEALAVHWSVLPSHWTLPNADIPLKMVGNGQKLNISASVSGNISCEQLIANAPQCNICHKRFKDEGTLQTHIAEADHKVPKPPAPPRVKRWYPRKPSVPFTCEECEQHCPNLREYLQHFRQAHPGMNQSQYTSSRPTYICEVCGKILKNVTHMKYHHQSHTEDVKYSCEKCQATFKNRLALRSHMNDHTKSRRCKICGKMYASYGSLRKHISMHTGYKPHKCDRCDKRFYMPSEKRVHIKHFHLGVPWPKKRPKSERIKRNFGGKFLSDVDKMDPDYQNEGQNSGIEE